jgi:hypothetical protein
MGNDQWNQQPSQEGHLQPQWGQQQQWEQPSPQYGQQLQQWQQQPQYGQQQWQQQQQYGANQYNVPSYAQAQPDQTGLGGVLMGWLMMRLAVRIAMLVLVFLLCGGCIFAAILTSLAH